MIDVIGTDAGAPGSLPPGAQLLVEQAHLLAAPKRLLPALQQWSACPSAQRCIASDNPIALSEELLALGSDQRAVVLASGDPLWFGIGRILIERLGRERLRFHPGPSSLQLAFARLGRPWQDAQWLSLHGRDPAPLAQRLQQRPRCLGRAHRSQSRWRRRGAPKLAQQRPGIGLCPLALRIAWSQQ